MNEKKYMLRKPSTITGEDQFPTYGTEHKGEHSVLRQWFVKKIVEVNGGKKLGTDELSGYLGKWLIDHILKEDKRVGQAATLKMG